MDHTTLFIILVIALAYCFDFINGFHDASNTIACIVATGVLSPKKAVLWAAFFNLIAFLCFNLMVAKTIGYGIVDPHVMNPSLIFSALISAIFWELLTWYYGLPTSASHALVGGLAGAAIIQGGLSTLQSSGLIKIAIGIFISPILGLIIGLCLTWCLKHWISTKKRPMTRFFNGLQLLSSALLSLAHGGNDAQKTMGIIAVLLFSASWLNSPLHIPFWVVISCNVVISLGTLLGGWRVVHTLGQRITTLNTMHGCAAETSAALIILSATELGIPVSTTQTVTGTIAGTGLLNPSSPTQWPVVRRIFASWLMTLPATAIIAAIIKSILT
jgi:PiT family inorganic phosphate transporter